jgi:transposase InsO family protein
MARISGWFGISRQAHYQMLHRRQKRQQQNEYILSRVREFRQRHPWMGARKILHELRPELHQKGFLTGRDRFFALLAQYDLLLPRRYQKRRTTWSGLWHAPNLIKTLRLLRVQQVWVCDITYLETEEGFCYLALVTDAFSRFITGFDVSTSLAVEGALRALEMGIAQARLPLEGLIHHSDHGVQYTCHAYRDELAKHKILSSMGEVGNCYDNALAERVNGILKLEYALNSRFVTVAQAVTAVKQAVWLYNFERPHLSLNYAKPAEVHINSLHKSGSR